MAEERRGFAGFDSLVTDLSDLPPPPPPPAPRDQPASAPVFKQNDQEDRTWNPRWPMPIKGSAEFWIVAGLVAVGLGVLIFVDKTSESRWVPTVPSGPTSTYIPPGTTATAQYNLTQPVGEPEQKPPIGKDLVLSTEQLRYCLSQSARLDGGEKAVNTTSKFEVERFNSLVDDYNARCIKYRYRPSTMKTVKAEVEARRAQLEKEGVALIRSMYAR
jgi:hypothetical protein